MIQLLKKNENAVVILGCRNRVEWLGQKNVIIEKLDLTSFSSVRKFVATVKKRIGKHKLRGLVNCAQPQGVSLPASSSWLPDALKKLYEDKVGNAGKRTTG